MSNPALLKGKNPHPWKTPITEPKILASVKDPELLKFIDHLKQVSLVVSTTWGKYFALLDDLIGGGFPSALGQIWWMRSNLGGIQTVGSNILSCPYFVQLTEYTTLSPYVTNVDRCAVMARIAPASSACIWDILWHRYNGSGWDSPVSIFPSGLANKMVLPVGDVFAMNTTLDLTQYADLDILQVDCLQADGVCDGAHLTLRGVIGIN